jgi:NADH-quinone oxidoreductase subunit L
MLVVVTTVSALVHLYSFGYMAHDENWREGEPTGALLRLSVVLHLRHADAGDRRQPVQLFFGWEGVGLASYLLIGFYWRKPSANAAAIKAFVVNRVGDFGFLLGIAALFFLVDSISFDVIFASGEELAETTVTLPVDRLERGQPGGLPAVRRRDGQVGAAVPAHLAARRDGGARRRSRR